MATIWLAVALTEGYALRPSAIAVLALSAGFSIHLTVVGVPKATVLQAGAETRPSTKVPVEMAYPDAFARCLSALHVIPGIVVNRVDHATGRIKAKVPGAWGTGQLVTVHLIPDGNRTLVALTVRPQNRLMQFDQGRDERTFNLVLEEIVRSPGTYPAQSQRILGVDHETWHHGAAHRYLLIAALAIGIQAAWLGLEKKSRLAPGWRRGTSLAIALVILVTVVATLRKAKVGIAATAVVGMAMVVSAIAAVAR